MNYNKNKTKFKNEMKKNFLILFIIQGVKHPTTHKLKEIRQKVGELVREYDKIFKYILNQNLTRIEAQLLV